MRRIVLAAMTTLSAVVLLFGYRTSTGGTVAAAPVTGSSAPTTATAPSTPGAISGAGAGSDPSSGSSGSGSSGSSSTGSGSGTYDGSVASTRWGDVQVRITVQNGKITSAQTLTVPSGNGRDVEINDYAVPVLNQEVVQAQSAKIDTVSGATVTSEGYITSLQSALDKAGL